jgi:hypothetical protein
MNNKGPKIMGIGGEKNGNFMHFQHFTLRISQKINFLFLD